MNSEKRKGGRPKKEIDCKLAEDLSSIMCTQEEIATVLGCDVRTLQRSEEFCRAFKKGRERGKASLRRIQWKLAEHNAAVAIWLGKQYLDQTDFAPEPEKDDKVIVVSDVGKEK
mgnify:CR=1 FL=1